ncbi:SmORF protein [Babesia bovis T2Bo]|uniref:SmORF n=1 Tax=Babesia bovis TaxID=5865 RepID=A7ARI1_BABBO|nr:SmORF protein [Babesia bovis T2Bo]EDO07150.1 SmORF protein [Babesia bovis T2Bo]|eukprot:XP_001610718.1 SmORF [Babesia bovis T2Bo]
MVTFNILWKLCLVVAFGLSATVTSTDVAQEQPKKESFLSRFFGKKESTATKPVEEKEASSHNTQGYSDPNDPPKYSVEWYLLPKPENRAALRKALPSDIAEMVPKDYKRRIWSALEGCIIKFFKIEAAEWYLLPEPESRAALRYVLPSDLAAKVPEDSNEAIKPEVEKDIRKLFSQTFQKGRLTHSWSTAMD